MPRSFTARRTSIRRADQRRGAAAHPTLLLPHCPTLTAGTLAAGTLAAGTPGRPRRPRTPRRPPPTMRRCRASHTAAAALPHARRWHARSPAAATPAAPTTHDRRADNARPPASHAAPATPAALLPCSSAASLSKPRTIRFAWCSAMRSRAEYAADAITGRVCCVVNSRCFSVSCSLVGSRSYLV
jgi:hypothetical protein